MVAAMTIFHSPSAKKEFAFYASVYRYDNI